MSPPLYCTRIPPSRLYFPWYNKIKRQLDDLEQRYFDLGEKRCIRSPFTNTTQGKYFILCRQRTTRCSSVFNASVEKEFIPDDKEEKLKIESFTTEQILQKVDSGDVLVVPYKINTYFVNNNNLNCKIIVVATDTKEYTDANNIFQKDPNIKVSRLEDLKDIASLTLEESMFEPMKSYAETLDKSLQNDQKYGIRKEESVPEKIERKRYRKTPYKSENKKVHTRAKHLEKRKEENVDHCKDSSERLYKEILGVFKRSRIPEHKKPDVRVIFPHKVGDEVSNELYKIDSSVKSCGYRYGTLQVFVDDVSNDEIKNSIQKVLQTNGINDFEIVPAISTYKSFIGVGARACPTDVFTSHGSLGGYAKRNSRDMCALVSRHVAIYSKDMRVSLFDQNSSIRSRLIPETVADDTDEPILDISAAEINPRDTPICDTRFKSECGKSLPRKDCEYENKQLDSRRVHLWGAVTAPGLGIITIPEVRDRNHDKTYIIVEDRANATAVLCREGDSGAMVCADDDYGSGVEAISMLIGKDTTNPGKYATFRIDKGLQQLEKQTDSSFSLCQD
ncbi:uncharacterized protein LOC132758353 [Ruditapes philippinarum]|uniref:uncharacterized protein LOC132758353 n=1 Tax=Ruditapes philippinarum TaxID=129788 RepID=UPI00295B6670|nr:uncharacterized protein LOC132758353 [Ruditapes philippinarum]